MWTGADNTQALIVSMIVGVVYMALLRLIDLNEREPLWSLALLFLLGMVAAGFVHLLVSSVILELNVFQGALAEEVAKFGAVAAGFAILAVVARWKGWSDLNGVMDGIIYGAAAGLGFATGDFFIRGLSFVSPALTMPEVGLVAVFWSNALQGLSHGMFGALSGAGLAAAAIHGDSLLRSILFAAGGLFLAFAVHVGHETLAFGASLDPAGYTRLWIAMLLPAVLVVALWLNAISRERSAIRDELGREREGGIVTDSELDVLRRYSRRQALYVRMLLHGDFSQCTNLMALHNRQVQLALTKKRRVRESGGNGGAGIPQEIDRLRNAILRLRTSLISK